MRLLLPLYIYSSVCTLWLFLKFFCLSLVLSKLMMMCLVIISFMFPVLQGHRTSWVFGFTVFIKVLKIFNYFYFKYFFCLPFPCFAFRDFNLCILDLELPLTFFHSSRMSFSLFSIIDSLCVSIWIVAIAPSSNSPIFLLQWLICHYSHQV